MVIIIIIVVVTVIIIIEDDMALVMVHGSVSVSIISSQFSAAVMSYNCAFVLASAISYIINLFRRKKIDGCNVTLWVWHVCHRQKNNYRFLVKRGGCGWQKVKGWHHFELVHYILIDFFCMACFWKKKRLRKENIICFWKVQKKISSFNNKK